MEVEKLNLIDVIYSRYADVSFVMSADVVTGLDYALRAKLSQDEDRLYTRWLSERQYIKDDRYRDNFQEYLALFRQKPVTKEDKEVAKARIDANVAKFEKKLAKGV